MAEVTKSKQNGYLDETVPHNDIEESNKQQAHMTSNKHWVGPAHKHTQGATNCRM
jgi:hypothetical protein